MENIVLTGGSGFIGSHLLKNLINNSYNVFCLIRKTSDLYRIKDILGTANLKLIYCDDIKEIEKVFTENKISYIVHLATTYKKTHETDDIDAMIDANIRLGTYLCELSLKYGVKYFINTGTFFEYKHYKDKENILSEYSEECPLNLYASTKLSFNSILKYYTNNSAFKAITLRLFSPYGPNDNVKIIPLLIKNIINDGVEELKSSGGEQRLCFTYVDDIVNAYLKCLENIELLGNNYEIFNIGSNDVYSLREIYKYLCEISGRNGNVIFGAFPYASNEIFYSKCDNSKAKELLGREPTISIKDGLSLTYNNYNNDFGKN